MTEREDPHHDPYPGSTSAAAARTTGTGFPGLPLAAGGRPPLSPDWPARHGSTAPGGPDPCPGPVMDTCACGGFAHQPADLVCWQMTVRDTQPKPGPAALSTLIMLASRLDPVTGCGRVASGQATADAGVTDRHIAAEAWRWARKHGLLIPLERGGNRIGGPVMSAWALALPAGHTAMCAMAHIAVGNGQTPGQPAMCATDHLAGNDETPGQPTMCATAHIDSRASTPDPPKTQNPRSAHNVREPGEAQTHRNDETPGQPTMCATDHLAGKTVYAQVSPQCAPPEPQKTQNPRSAHNVRRPPLCTNTGIDLDLDQKLPAVEAGASPAAGTSETQQDHLPLGCPDPPDPPGPSPAQRAKALTDWWYDAVPGHLCNWNAARQILRRAINARQWTDEQITAALTRLLEASRPLTAETLRVELTGPPRPAPNGRPMRGGQASDLSHARYGHTQI